MKERQSIKKRLFLYVYLPLAAFFIFVVSIGLYHYSFNRLLVFELDQSQGALVKFKIEKEENYKKSNLPIVASNQISFKNLDDYYEEILQEYKSDQQFEFDDFENISPSELKSSEATYPVYQKLQSRSVVIDQDGTDQFIEGVQSSFSKKGSGGSNLSDSQKAAQEKQLKIGTTEARLELKNYYNKRFFHNYNSEMDNIRKSFLQKRFVSSPTPLDSGEGNNLLHLQDLKLVVGKDKYYRFEIVRVNLVAKTSIDIDDLKVYVVRNGVLRPNVGGKHDVKFRYENGIIYASIALGYNPLQAVYSVVVQSLSQPEWKGTSASFQVVHSDLPSVQGGFSVINLEYVASLDNKEIRGPDGEIGDYKMIAKWLKYVDVDALWMLAAQTSGWYSKTSPTNPWVSGGLRNLELLAPVIKENNLQLGAYIMSFYTPGNGKKIVGYKPSLGYDKQTGTLYASKHVSLIDERRLKDMTEIARSFQQNKYVDFIGFDFIRTGRADGYEMGPQVVKDMNIPTPRGYEYFTDVEKTKWFAQLVENLSNESAVRKWRWWRAHRVATIVHNVIKDAGINKPVWVYTLGWSWGHQHGQDPYMFFDAGVFIDAVMLYEASKEMFANMMVMWPRYMFLAGNNLMVGNSTDVRLLDSKWEHPAVEYVYRSKKGYRRIYRNGLARGIFMHDISRALWSSYRGLEMEEWAIVHGYVTSAYRSELGLIPYRGTISFSDDQRKGVIRVENLGNATLSSIKLRLAPTHAWQKVTDDIPESFSLKPGEKKVFTFDALVRPEHRNRENILGYYLDSPVARKYFFFTYRVGPERMKQYYSYSR